eukprot:TRINITY_DN22964_c0_g1_i1.p1 TRINITY_DN22964_c0_g1~~TRINITY_DN22964_c0_g1_i1.p1  ORF type:complete len:638 (+),score=80.85 TRINITY_DN22964_c0_g1_i1:184-1914(+)
MQRFNCKSCDYDLCEGCYLSKHGGRRCLEGHLLQPLGLTRDNGWSCDGRKQPGGCKSGILGFHETKGQPRYRCSTCDYDLCERCYETPDADGKCCRRGHPLLSLGVSRDNGWACDLSKEPAGCRRGLSAYHMSRGVPRYRCERCDFDACDECYETLESTGSKALERASLPRSTSVELDEVPSHWDMSIMSEIDMAAGLCPDDESQKNLYGEVELTEEDISVMQHIFDASYRKIFTRDRGRGGRVPDGLQVVAGVRIQNAQNWKEYVKKLEQIRGQIASLRQSGTPGVCKNGHILVPQGTTRDNGWACDARKEGMGGCESGITDFHQTSGMNRFRCPKCDFDYCEKCYLMRTGRKLCCQGHALVPLGRSCDNGWSCDGHRLHDGCLSGNNTRGLNRYRCETCDFDLCAPCFQRHVGSVNNSVDALKTREAASSLLGPELDQETNSVWLFHGTNDAAARLITTGDFLVDKACSNAGTLYGRGVYLAESCSKSDEYTRENADGYRCMLLCRAILGNVLYDDHVAPNVDSLVRQCVRGTYHSVLGDREKSRKTYREFIVYDDDQVYPEFIVWYKRVYDSA